MNINNLEELNYQAYNFAEIILDNLDEDFKYIFVEDVYIFQPLTSLNQIFEIFPFLKGFIFEYYNMYLMRVKDNLLSDIEKFYLFDLIKLDEILIPVKKTDNITEEELNYLLNINILLSDERGEILKILDEKDLNRIVEYYDIYMNFV